MRSSCSLSIHRVSRGITGFSINTPLNERIEVNRDLIHLAQDFIYSSSTYGKIVRAVSSLRFASRRSFIY